MNQPPNGALETLASVNRQHVYVPAGNTALFGWYHSSPAVQRRRCVAIICVPMGYEYTHSHRSVRHLCDELARAGIDALRFDYHGTGDSPGGDLESDRIDRWQSDIASAVQFAKQRSGATQCAVIGIRFGGMLASLATRLAPPDFLILWSTPASGKRYLRELTIAAATNPQKSSDGLLESGGFLISTQTADAIKGINLLQQPIAVQQRVLLIHRDDLQENPELGETLRTSGVEVDECALPGFADMMAEPQFTIIPSQAIAYIANWLARQTETKDTTSYPAITISDSITFMDGGLSLHEHAYRFGVDQHLFGILSSTELHPTDKPTVILLSSGTVHRTGPGRLYVALARALAHNGFNCFRIDIEGVGDSILRGEGVENHPYPDTAVDDAAAALHFLQKEIAASNFILLGLCSGAHAAFHTAIKQRNDPIREIVSINPLTFRWVEGMTLETTQHFQDVEYYKGSAKNLKSWLKLLSGKVDIANLINIARKQAWLRLKASLRSIREILTQEPTSELGHDLKTLADLDRSLNLFIASGDPGYNLLIHGAGRYASRQIASGKIHLHFIENADHTFSRTAPRTQLINAIMARLTERFAMTQPLMTRACQASENTASGSGTAAPESAMK